MHTLLSDYEEHGLVPHHHPLSDNEIPSKQQCVNLLRELWVAIQKRRRAVVQCVTKTFNSSVTDFSLSVVVLMAMVELVLVSIGLLLCAMIMAAAVPSVLSLLAMILDPSLLPAAAIVLVQQARGPAAIQTVKVY